MKTCFFVQLQKSATGTLRKKFQFFPGIVCKLKDKTKKLNQRCVCFYLFDGLCKHSCPLGV